VPFLADLVTLADPTSRWSFLSYLREHDRLYRFYFSERFHVPRREYDHYCRWVAERLPSCRFGRRVAAIRWHRDAFVVDVDGEPESLRARNVVLGVGTEPVVPPALAGALGDRVFHSSEFVGCRAACETANSVTVVGSGQSAAEVFHALLLDQPAHGYRLEWLTRSAGFFPMEYSKLGLEHFTPEYTRYVHALPEAVRDGLVPSQDLLYKGIDAETIAAIYDLLYERTVGGHDPDVCLLAHTAVQRIDEHGDGLRLACRQWEAGVDFTVDTGCVVLATGYAARVPACLQPLEDLVAWDSQGRYRVGLDYRVETKPSVTGGLFVQNGELHTHGVGAPDLGLGAHRAAVIVNEIAAREVYRLPSRVGFTSFIP